jgi:hypothetical protein
MNWLLVSAALVVMGFALVFAYFLGLSGFDPGAAEGPYQKRLACRAVCK